jgi:DNA-binding transcriptional ArsR family regulator
MQRILWWLIAGSRGGMNRARILEALHHRPYNANQLTQRFGLDYKTVRYHLDVLKRHQVIISLGEGYGTMYFLSDRMQSHYSEFLEIWHQVDTPGSQGG